LAVPPPALPDEPDEADALADPANAAAGFRDADVMSGA
jgi:hypothetical protein